MSTYMIEIYMIEIYVHDTYSGCIDTCMQACFSYSVYVVCTYCHVPSHPQLRTAAAGASCGRPAAAATVGAAVEAAAAAATLPPTYVHQPPHPPTNTAPDAPHYEIPKKGACACQVPKGPGTRTPVYPCNKCSGTIIRRLIVHIFQSCLYNICI